MNRDLKQAFYSNEGPWRWKVGLQAAHGIGLSIPRFSFLGKRSFGRSTSIGSFTILFGTSKGSLLIDAFKSTALALVISFSTEKVQAERKARKG